MQGFDKLEDIVGILEVAERLVLETRHPITELAKIEGNDDGIRKWFEYRIAIGEENGIVYSGDFYQETEDPQEPSLVRTQRSSKREFIDGLNLRFNNDYTIAAQQLLPVVARRMLDYVLDEYAKHKDGDVYYEHEIFNIGGDDGEEIFAKIGQLDENHKPNLYLETSVDGSTDFGLKFTRESFEFILLRRLLNDPELAADAYENLREFVMTQKDQ